MNTENYDVFIGFSFENEKNKKKKGLVFPVWGRKA